MTERVNKKNSYQYKECGLDYVWLSNGFEYINSPRGRRIQIDDPEGLHKVIADYVVSEIKDLKGPEIRFLRHRMDISQSILARLLNTTEQSIRRWENDKSPINKSAEALFRILYQAYASEDHTVPVREVLAELSSLELEISKIDKKELNLSNNDEWRKTA